MGNLFNPGAYVTDSPAYAAAKQASIGPSRDPYSAQYAADKAAQMTPGTVAGDGAAHANRPPNYLGFPTNAAENYFEQNPTSAFQLYVNKLGGPDSALGRYAAGHFGQVYGQYLQQAGNNPNLLWTDYLNTYAQGGQLTQGYQGAPPSQRDLPYTPQWAPGRFLG